MVANINKFKGKMIENGYSLTKFANEISMCETTLRRKMTDTKYEFTI